MRIKDKIHSFLEKLAQENQEQFEDGKPSCCSGKQNQNQQGKS